MKTILLGSLGVLSDTTALWRTAYRRAFLEHGLHLEPRRGRPQLSRRAPRPGDRTAIPVDVVLRARNIHYGALLARGPLARREGLDALLDAVAARGIGLGLVATTPFDWLVAVLDGLTLAPECFDAIVTGAHVSADKPAPDCYHLAAAMLATAAEDCLVVEDTRAGVAAARAAGMQVMDLTGRPEAPLADLLAALPARVRPSPAIRRTVSAAPVAHRRDAP